MVRIVYHHHNKKYSCERTQKEQLNGKVINDCDGQELSRYSVQLSSILNKIKDSKVTLNQNSLQDNMLLLNSILSDLVRISAIITGYISKNEPFAL